MDKLTFKKIEAINKVKTNLALYADIMTNGFMTINERVPSFTTSILAMPEGSRSGIGLGEKVTQAMVKELQENEFIKTYSAIISSLSNKQQDIINRRYFQNMTFNKIEIGDEMTAGDKRAYKKLNEVYVLIACMDDDIDFSFNDYVDLKKEEKKDEFDKNERKKIKAITLSRIKLLLMQKKDNANNDWIILNKIPKNEKDLLIDYIKENHRDFSSDEYKKINKAIFTFAYLHPEIEMSRDLFISSFGINDHRKAVKIADHQISLFDENKEEKEITHD